MTTSHLHPRPSYDLADHPMPTGREEVWRFTPLARLRTLLRGEPTRETLTWQQILPAGVTVAPIDVETLAALDLPAPVDLPAALAANRAGSRMRIDVPDFLSLTEPVVIDLWGDTASDVVFGQIVITVGIQARATIVVRHRGSATYGNVTSVIVGDGSDVTYVSLQDWAADAVHTGQTSVRVGRDARVRTVNASLGGGLVRIVENADYTAPGGELEQFGLYFVDEGQHLEHRLFVDHNQPRTRSNVDYRGALQGEGAHAVWIGDVLIREVAEGITTYESNRNLVLTDGCRVDSVPNLEIETGEIEGAGHSSTTGRFDDEQLFYLRSRGISESEARRLVVEGFFAEIIRRIGVTEVEGELTTAIQHELAVTMGARSEQS